MNRLWKFGDAAIDLEKVWAVADGFVLFEDGFTFFVGMAACKALVAAMPCYPMKEGRTETPLQDGDGLEGKEKP